MWSNPLDLKKEKEKGHQYEWPLLKNMVQSWGYKTSKGKLSPPRPRNGLTVQINDARDYGRG